MNCSTPGLPVHHQLPESTQTHVHCVRDAIQSSHPLSSPSPPTSNLSQHQCFSKESVLRIRRPKYWSFSFNISPSNEHPGLISFSMDWLDLKTQLKVSRRPEETFFQRRIHIANRHMKRCSTLLIIREMQVKITASPHTC